MTENTIPPDPPTGLAMGAATCSPTIGKLALAMAKAQAEFGHLGKDSKANVRGKNAKTGAVVEYSYTYATLADSIDAIRKALTDNGIALLQPVTMDRNAVQVTTILAHESGEWMSSDLSMPVGENRAQAVGSAISYARRYALQSMVGLAADDDDGAEANANPPKAKAKAKKPSPMEEARVKFGNLLRERLEPIHKAWPDATWQEVACGAAGLKQWPDQPDLKTLIRAIGRLESATDYELMNEGAPDESEGQA